jgi:5,10-methylenetetrahydromethanopterin reductase
VIDANGSQRVGICFTGGPYSVQQTTECVKLAEEAGFDSAWGCDDIGGRDPFIPMTAWALATQRIRIGLAVTNPYTRHPVSIAASIATLDEASDGRTVLGIGTGASWRSLISDQWVKRVGYMKESIQVIRGLLAEQDTTYRGVPVSLRDSLWVWPDAPPASFRPDIPIYVGAGGPQMRRLTARMADGFLIAMGKFTSVIREEIADYRIALSEADRADDGAEVAALILISVGQNDKELAVMRRIVAFQTHRLTEEVAEGQGIELDRYRRIKEIYDRHAAEGDVVKYGTEPAALAAAPHVTQAMMDAFGISGDHDRCVGLLKRYRETGVTTPVLVSVGCDVRESIEVGRRFLSGE